ncbi:MAG: hypothetical protein UY03_C0005G0025 [Parcubacteria group bacterium GW2011_GWA2_47_64]|nr:MAG: hypothetical protein UY03_C0005G0025 [Parcubacteria group bacterium GW2011_GWA2_47_64]KKU96679.1 MAG: hypothetical protein UY29_C0008G0007 [Parcubacteria group bacterium GW2011_GWC2_48_17]
MRRLKKWKIPIYGLFALAFLAFVFAISRDPLNAGGTRLQTLLLQNKLVQNLIPTYHSLRKLPDILFFPYEFRKSNLPTYHIIVQPVEMLTLSQNLPDDHFGGQLTNDERIYVKALFQSGDYSGEVKLRYRGLSAHHWNSFQRSFKVKFPSDHVFGNGDELNLVIPYDRGYFVEPLNFYRAKKLGISVLPMEFVRVNWNGEDMGVYLASLNWSDKMLDRETSPLIVYGADDARGAKNAGKTNSTRSFALETPIGPIYFSNYTSREATGNLEALMTLIYTADDEAFKRVIGTLVDLPKFYAWSVVTILAGSVHFDDTFGNLFIIFNPTTGKFEFSIWDPGLRALKTADGQYEDDRMRIARRIFNIPEFRAERDRLLKSYIENEENLKDDLAFFDGLYANTKSDFFSDNAKLYNNFQFLRQVRAFRKIIVKNMSDAALVFSYRKEYYDKAEDKGTVNLEKLSFKDSFAKLAEAGREIDEFVALHPSFQKRGTDEIALSAGAHSFSEDVIIPPNLRLTIEPGATLYLDAGVSIISYSKVVARGTAPNPIRIQRANPQKPWGIFGVVSAPGESVWEYVETAGGSGKIQNGMTFTGMVSFFHSNVTVGNSSFMGAEDDDSLNVKYGKAVIRNSLWKDNAHDGIDLDSPKPGSEVVGNRFLNNGIGGGEGGDCLDLSRTNSLIKQNTIDGCTDKGISVGEQSAPVIINNTIANVSIGIAVKDLSDALIANTTITNADVGIYVYQKHPIYGGATARVSNTSMNGVKEEYRKDSLSTIEIK